MGVLVAFLITSIRQTDWGWKTYSDRARDGCLTKLQGLFLLFTTLPTQAYCQLSLNSADERTRLARVCGLDHLCLLYNRNQDVHSSLL